MPAQQLETKSALVVSALVCEAGILGCTQQSAVQLGLAGAIPALSRQIAITRVSVLPRVRRNKECGLLRLKFEVF